MSDIIVKFRPDGDKRLVESINKLQRATGNHTTIINKNTVATDKNRKSQSGLLKSQRLISGSFATMRSHLLLFNFAMGLGISQIVKFGKQAAKIDSMETAFNTLTGGVGSASIALDKLQEATNGTMSQFDLFQQANNAMILGVTKNSDEMAEMFDMAQRLGRALGRDTASSVESLITGIGRQSRLMLDNIGIIVKSDEAYQDYARSIGKTKDSLTDAEKKQAFMNATLESARKKLKTLGDETSSTQDSYDRLTASVADTGAEIGEVVNNAFIPLIDATTDFFDSLDTEKIRLLTELITTLGLTFAAFKVYALGAVVATRLLTAAKVALVASIGGLRFALGAFLSVLTGVSAVTLGWVTVIGSAIFALLRLTGVFGKSEKEADKLSGSVNEIQDAMDRTSTTNINQELQDFIDKMIESNAFLSLIAKTMDIDLIESIKNLKEHKLTDFLSEKEIEEFENNVKSIKDRMNELSVMTAIDPMTMVAISEEITKLENDLALIEEPFNNIKELISQLNLNELLSELALPPDFFQIGELEALRESIGTTITTEEQLLAVLNAIEKETPALSAAAMELIATNTTWTESNKETADSLKLIENTFKSSTQGQIETLGPAIEALKTKKELTKKEAIALDILLAKQAKLTAARKLETNQLYQNADAYAQIGESIMDVGEVAGMHQKDMIAVQIIAGIANAYKAASDTWADTTIQPTWLRGAAAVSHFASAYAQVRGMQNQMQKLGGSGSAPQFAEGGYVGGRPHSQGGTIIEAERGEFVMSRNATESIGLETLNQMNQSGGGGSINVSVTGNVLTQDFVEGELAESIKEAVRRGSDFGLS